MITGGERSANGGAHSSPEGTGWGANLIFGSGCCCLIDAGESLANGGPHSSMEPIRLPSSAAKPFGAQSEWPAFGMSSGSGAPPQSPAASPARSTGSAASGEILLAAMPDCLWVSDESLLTTA